MFTLNVRMLTEIGSLDHFKLKDNEGKKYIHQTRSPRD